MIFKVLVVGVGNMGSSHARAYHKINDFKLVGLVSRTPNKRNKLAIELGDVPQFDNFDTALKQADPDIVSINSYTETHKEFAIKSLNNGSHIFIEKPLAENIKDAKEIIDLAINKNKKIVVGYILRHHPTWQKFINLSQGLGSPLVMRMNLNQQSSEEQWEIHKNLMMSTSPIVDCGVHYVDIMCQMTKSKPVYVNAIGANLSDEIKDDMYNYGHLQITFENGSVGWYEAGWGPMISKTAFFVKDVIGPNGSVSIVEPNEKTEIKSSDIDTHTKTNMLQIHNQKRDKSGKFIQNDQFINTQNEPDHNELCELEQKYLLKTIKEDLDISKDMEDVIKSMKIVLAADKSIKTGKQVKI